MNHFPWTRKIDLSAMYKYMQQNQAKVCVSGIIEEKQTQHFQAAYYYLWFFEVIVRDTALVLFPLGEEFSVSVRNRFNR